MGMEAKEYLSQLRVLDIKIKQRIEEISALRASLTNVSAVCIECERVQGSNAVSDAAFLRTLVKIDEMEKTVNEYICNYITEKHRIINEIQSLKNKKHIEILYKKYVEFKGLEVVASEMNYTYQYIILLHGYALKEFYKKFQYKFNI